MNEHQTIIHGNIVLKDMVIVPIGLHTEAMAALYEKRLGRQHPSPSPRFRGKCAICGDSVLEGHECFHDGVPGQVIEKAREVETPPPTEVNPAQMKRQLATMMGVPEGFEPAGELKRRLDELMEAAQETPDGPASEDREHKD